MRLALVRVAITETTGRRQAGIDLCPFQSFSRQGSFSEGAALDARALESLRIVDSSDAEGGALGERALP
jgi:hypothetical protein